jgi:hypothetical protein
MRAAFPHGQLTLAIHESMHAAMYRRSVGFDADFVQPGAKLAQWTTTLPPMATQRPPRLSDGFCRTKKQQKLPLLSRTSYLRRHRLDPTRNEKQNIVIHGVLGFGLLAAAPGTQAERGAQGWRSWVNGGHGCNTVRRTRTSKCKHSTVQVARSRNLSRASQPL